MMTSHNKENKAAVEQYSKGKILWQLTRPHTLTASFVPVLIGTVLAMFYGHVNVWMFLAMLFHVCGFKLRRTYLTSTMILNAG